MPDPSTIAVLQVVLGLRVFSAFAIWMSLFDTYQFRHTECFIVGNDGQCYISCLLIIGLSLLMILLEFGHLGCWTTFEYYSNQKLMKILFTSSQCVLVYTLYRLFIFLGYNQHVGMFIFATISGCISLACSSAIFKMFIGCERI